MVEAVVEVARVVFGRDEVDRILAVEGVSQVGAVTALAQKEMTAVLPGLTLVVREHQVRIEVNPAVEVVDPTGGQAEQVVVGDVVGLERGSGFPGRFEHAWGAPRERVAGLGKPVEDLSILAVFTIQREDALVGQHQESGTVVIVLLEVGMKDRFPDGAGGEVVGRDLDVSTVRVRFAGGERPDRSHRAHDERITEHDGAFVHEPRPGTVVVELDQLRRRHGSRAVPSRVPSPSSGKRERAPVTSECSGPLRILLSLADRTVRMSRLTGLGTSNRL